MGRRLRQEAEDEEYEEIQDLIGMMDPEEFYEGTSICLHCHTPFRPGVTRREEPCEKRAGGHQWVQKENKEDRFAF